MSAPSESAESPYPCACTNISLMQLFHELKQKFPGVPDHVVSNTIELYCHDKQACETHLHSEVKASLTHAYHASSSAAARQLNELKLNPPSKCRNQPIIKHESVKATPLEAIICQGPQAAILSLASSGDCEKIKINTDANQNVLEPTETQKEECNSPVTVINIDNCTKYSGGSPSDLELTNENIEVKQNSSQTDAEQAESTNYRILKSNKIRCNLNERLEKTKEKKTIRKEVEKIDEQEQKQEEPEPISVEKPKRPNTLDFIKPNPDPAFKQTLRKPENETCQSISPVPPPVPQKQEPLKENKCTPQKSGYSGYPLNVSVNVNMDLSGGYDPWLEDYENRRAITSVNLTVCTPTSNMASPVRDTREDDGGFEGHVTVTVSPSTARAPRRRAPAPPGPHTARLESPRPTRAAPEPPSSAIDRSLIERQKERLSRLAMALEQERGRLAQLKRETHIMGAPPPSPAVLLRLRETVKQWRDRCDDLSKRVESDSYEVEDTRNFYSNIYTGQRPAASWQCHMCTFRNHPLLDKCEECDMPRILVVRASDGITVRLVPGRRTLLHLRWIGKSLKTNQLYSYI